MLSKGPEEGFRHCWDIPEDETKGARESLLMAVDDEEEWGKDSDGSQGMGDRV